MNETTIRLPDETVNYLQRLDYEVAGLQVLHTHALNAGTPLEKRMEIRREHQEVFAEYQLAKQEMWAEFAPRFPRFHRWWVDFQTGELHIETPVGEGLAPPASNRCSECEGGRAKALPYDGIDGDVGSMRASAPTDGKGEEGDGHE